MDGVGPSHDREVGVLQEDAAAGAQCGRHGRERSGRLGEMDQQSSAVREIEP